MTNVQANSHSHLFQRTDAQDYPTEVALPTAHPGAGAVLLDALSGEVHRRPPTRSGDTKAGDPSDILSTAVNSMGNPVGRSSIDSESRVTVGGVQARVADLVNAGVLEKLPDGTFQRAEATPQGNQKDTSEADNTPGEAFAPQVEEMAADLAGSTSITNQVAAIHDLAMTGDLSEESVNALAHDMGLSQAQAVERLGAIVDAFQAQADTALTPYGDPSDIAAWARTNAPQLMQQAVRTHAETRSPRGYDAIGQAYLGALDSTEQGRQIIANAKFGPGVRVEFVRIGEGKSQALVYSPKLRSGVPWGVAVKQGLISPRFGAHK